MHQAAPAAPADLAEAAVARVLDDLDHTTGRGVVVDSPPGAGKSTLVVRAAGHLAARRGPVMIVAQTNEQVDDLAERLAVRYPGLRIGRLLAADRELPGRVARYGNVVGGRRLADLGPALPPVVVATAAKWSLLRAPDGIPWAWAIVDEAYQMRSDALLRCAGLFERALFVGDPGQLDPFATIETERWTGLTWDPLRNAVDVTLAHNPGMPVRQLPVSWRLPTTAARLVGHAFYPFTPFAPGTSPVERRIGLATAAFGADPVDEVLDRAAATGWGYLELPARHTLRTDRGVAEALAGTAARLLARGATTRCDQAPHGRDLAPERIAIGVAHNDQAGAVRAHLAPELAGVAVDTANKLQGREFDVTLVWHPLSGRADASAFHLETGRLCVLLSRHRQSCVVIARAGIRDLLDRHPSSQPVHLDVPPKFPDGWRAHQTVMDHLDRPEFRAAA